MRKDLEDWLKGNENPRSATLVADRRKPVIPYEADEWNLPVAFLPDLPVVFENPAPFPAEAGPPEYPRFADPGEAAEDEDYIDDDADDNDNENNGGAVTVELGASVEFAESAEPEREAETGDFADTAALEVSAGKLEAADISEIEKPGVAESSGLDELEETEIFENPDESEAVGSAEFEPDEFEPDESPEASVLPSGEISGEEGGTEGEANEGSARQADSKSDSVAPAGRDGGSRWSGQRFEERWRRIELARQMTARRHHVRLRQKYGRFIAIGVLVFLVAGAVLLTCGHLRRNSYNFLMTNAKTLYDGGMYEKSLEAYTEVSLIYPDRIDPFLGMALVSERLDRIGGAVEAYKRVLDLEPSHTFAQNELTRFSPAAEKVDGDLPGDAEVQKYDHAARMGEIALLAGSYGEAARYFSDALALRSGDANVWVNFAKAQAALGGDREAAKSLKTALSLDPANVEAKSRLSDIEKAAEKKAAAEKAAKKTTTAKKKRQPTSKKTRSVKSGAKASSAPPVPPTSSAPPKPAAVHVSEGGES